MTAVARAPRSAWADGLATLDSHGDVLDCWFPAPQLGEPTDSPTTLAAAEDELRGVRQTPIRVVADLDAPVASTADAYLRLHLLSHLLVRPNSINLDGIFGHLPTNAWTTRGPMPAAEVVARRVELRRAGVEITAVDKFPRLLDYVIPEGVRIADGGRVRLGAHLAPGTVIMHEGFVNFNAGTLGPSMIEGRISQGVVVGAGSDLGGGSSTMGTLSGGGTQRIAIGERALLGANAGIGIPIGDDCVVEAGLYVTAGAKVRLPEQRDADGAVLVVKALELAGVPNLLFRRNSTSGAIEVLSRTGAGIALNAQLH